MSDKGKNENQDNRVEEMVALAEKHGIRLQSEEVEINESGMDFLVAFAVDTDGVKWVLRKPRRSDVLERADNEHRVLKLLQQQLPVAVPDWRVYTPELIAYPLLNGIPAAGINVEVRNYEFNMDHENPPPQFVDSLAQALVALHSIDHDAAREAGLRVKSPAEARETLAHNMEKVKKEIGVSEELWERWQKWIADDSYWPTHSVLVHGDLHPPHIIIDEQQRVTGLLDWTEAEVTNPGTDFVLYCAVFGEERLAEFLTRYEEAGGRVWPRMKDHIVEQLTTYPVLLGLFALTSGDKEVMNMARAALGVAEA
ncbi:macrolide 2'-phosphotransferase [Paenibacillus sp. SC116]|uniref:macrolide 2'-phosphotransferase n=1 Tax=Paenibacillus sp. SC116 TaxID=2968986 RepID=UPI00215B6D20|nr:macrolide 2'-phosphotransferase [Paenibacillus sp. SC116]MCR8844561.1 macrolide 2'-phosphotransferase [Paenibacillus sp. SC116]